MSHNGMASVKLYGGQHPLPPSAKVKKDWSNAFNSSICFVARTVTNLPSHFMYRTSIRSVLISTDVSVRFVNRGEDQSGTVSFERCYNITASLGHASEPT